MNGINAFVKWLCGMALAVAALVLLAMFMIDYNRAQAQINAAEAAPSSASR